MFFEYIQEIEKLKQEQEEKQKKEEEEKRKREEEEEERLQRLKNENAAKQLENEKTAVATASKTAENLPAAESVVATVTTPKPVETSPFTMLTPQIISESTSQNFSAQQMSNGTSFDPLEFENQNDNPFEMAERATLNEFDVLRSVLEPDNQTNQASHVVKSEESNNDKEDFELSSIFFKQLVVTTATDTMPTSQLITVTDTATSNISANPTFVRWAAPKESRSARLSL